MPSSLSPALCPGGAVHRAGGAHPPAMDLRRPPGLAAKRTISDDQQVAGQPPHLPAKIFAAGVAPQTKYGPAQTKTCPCGGDWRLPSSATPWKQWGRQPSYKRDPDISVDNECIGHSPRIH
nr:uncharacterized protein LOC110378663 isoform X4 [Helicoverpa armigera]